MHILQFWCKVHLIIILWNYLYIFICNVHICMFIMYSEDIPCYIRATSGSVYFMLTFVLLNHKGIVDLDAVRLIPGRDAFHHSNFILDVLLCFFSLFLIFAFIFSLLIFSLCLWLIVRNMSEKTTDKSIKWIICFLPVLTEVFMTKELKSNIYHLKRLYSKTKI